MFDEEFHTVSYVTAQLAKQANFNQAVRYYYTKSRPPLVTTHQEFNSDRDAIINWNNNQGCYPLKPEQVACSAPLPYQLQSWILQHHQIHVTITSETQKSWQCHITRPQEPLNLLYFEDFPSYEEALDYGLQIALHQILTLNSTSP